MQVLYRDGVHVPVPDVWLDPHFRCEAAVVSHAHADHMKAHGQVFATPATAAMMRLRGAATPNFHEVGFHETFCYRDGEESPCVTLLPAGHVLGSSQVLVEHEGMKLLYSGDFKLRASRSSEVAEVPQADVLVMETTFGLPKYRFPDNEEVLGDIRRWCRSVLNTGSRPVVLCYSLGKGQEVLAGLDGVDFPIYLHEKHFHMANLYREFGVKLPPYRLYVPGAPLDGVLLCASGCRKGRWFADLARRESLKTSYVSGWALDAGAKWRFGTDHAFPLSDHAGYDDLMAYVGLSGAGTIYTMHGFDEQFARDLRKQGYLALPLKHAVEL
jgi:hypothetical protein